MDQLLDFLKHNAHGGTALTGALSSEDNQALRMPAPPPSLKVCEGLRQAVDEALAMGLAPTSRVVKAAVCLPLHLLPFLHHAPVWPTCCRSPTAQSYGTLAAQKLSAGGSALLPSPHYCTFFRFTPL